MHARVNTSGTPDLSMEDLFNNSTIIHFRYKEEEKTIQVRIVPQGVFYITFSKTKTISNESVVLKFTQNHLKFEVFGDPDDEKLTQETFLFEDTNDFSIEFTNTGITFKKLDPTMFSTFIGNFTQFIFMGVSSYNPAKWVIEEGKYVL